MKEVCFESPAGLCVLASPQKAVCSVKANHGYYEAINGVSHGMRKTQEKCSGRGQEEEPKRDIKKQ